MPVKGRKIASKARNKSLNHKNAAKRAIKTIPKKQARTRKKASVPVVTPMESGTVYEVLEADIYVEPTVEIEEEEEFGTLAS